jgi:hypothetical protein
VPALRTAAGLSVWGVFCTILTKDLLRSPCRR